MIPPFGGHCVWVVKNSENCDTIWVVVDRLTELAHFIMIHLNYLLKRLTELYIENIVSLYGISSSIVVDRILRLRRGSRRVCIRLFGIKMRLSDAYHPQTDG